MIKCESEVGFLIDLTKDYSDDIASAFWQSPGKANFCLLSSLVELMLSGILKSVKGQQI